MQKVKKLINGILMLPLVAVVVTAMLAGCGLGGHPSIVGTYVSKVSGQYSISSDTLIITALADGETYQVLRKAGFQRIRNGKILTMEHKSWKSVGRFDDKAKVLLLESQGKAMRFMPGGKLLLMNREYQLVSPK